MKLVIFKHFNFVRTVEEKSLQCYLLNLLHLFRKHCIMSYCIIYITVLCSSNVVFFSLFSDCADATTGAIDYDSNLPRSRLKTSLQVKGNSTILGQSTVSLLLCILIIFIFPVQHKSNSDLFYFSDCSTKRSADDAFCGKFNKLPVITCICVRFKYMFIYYFFFYNTS